MFISIMRKFALFYEKDGPLSSIYVSAITGHQVNQQSIDGKRNIEFERENGKYCAKPSNIPWATNKSYHLTILQLIYFLLKYFKNVSLRHSFSVRIQTLESITTGAKWLTSTGRPSTSNLLLIETCELST